MSFLKNNRKALIRRVRNINAILDDLVDVIADELSNEIKAMATPEEKFRTIFEITEKQGFSSQLIFFNSLYEAEQALIEDIMRTDNN